jgi:hypothetical protein
LIPGTTARDANALCLLQILRVSAAGIGLVYGSWKLSSLKVCISYNFLTTKKTVHRDTKVDTRVVFGLFMMSCYIFDTEQSC